MSNLKDLWGGVVLGTALTCVLYIGAMRTPANADTNAGQDTVVARQAAQANSTARIDD